MKKTAFLAALFLLVCLCASALAGGVSGLLGGSAPSASDALPDPADALSDGAYATQTEKNYDFGGGYYCNVFSYPQPVSVTKFVQDYSKLAEAAGYSMKETVLDGFDAYAVSNGDGTTAYILPKAGNDMLFLVETGMDFTPTPRRNFLSVERNGKLREYETYTRANTPRYYSYGYYSFDFLRDGNNNSDTLLFRLPNGFDVGDTFYVSKSSGLVSNLYFSEDLNAHCFLMGTSDYHNELKGSGDYFLLTITGREKTNFGERISATFEGSFHYGETVFENGVFSVDCYD